MNNEERVKFTITNSGVKVTTKNKFGNSANVFVNYVNENIGTDETVQIGSIQFVSLRKEYCKDGKELMLGISIPEFNELLTNNEVELSAFSKADVMELSQELTLPRSTTIIN